MGGRMKTVRTRFSRSIGNMFLLMGMLGFFGLTVTGCTTNPATGKRNLMLMSWDEERSLAAQAGPQFTEEYGGEAPDPAVQAYVESIGSKLTDAALEQAYASVPDLDWDYTLLDSSVINAFALPGGKVFVSRGLASKLQSEAQLAGVIGHEIGHVMARHGNQRMTQVMGMNMILGGLAIAVGSADKNSDFSKYGKYAIPALAVGGNVVLLSYGRDEELEADALGIQYMVANGWNPLAQQQVMEILKREAGGKAPPEWLSTHPASDTRIKRINELLKTQYAYTQNNPDYGFYPERYKTRMLDRLAKLPPPKQGGQSQADATLHERTMAASLYALAVFDPHQHAEAFDLSDPTTWCEECRLQATRPDIKKASHTTIER